MKKLPIAMLFIFLVGNACQSTSTTLLLTATAEPSVTVTIEEVIAFYSDRDGNSGTC